MTTKEQWIQFLEREHIISPEVWQKHGLKFDENYLYIPYKSSSGDLLFEKKRREPNFKGDKKYIYPTGSHITLYPHQDLSSSEEWILTEGELDCLTLESFEVGIPAITSGGVTSLKSELVDNFKNKKVKICFDNDEVGNKSAEKVAQKLLAVTSEVLIIDLPPMEDGKDIGDYFKSGHTKDDFLKLVKQARKIDNLSSGTEIPGGSTKQKLIEQALTYIEVEEKVKRLLPNSQTALKLVLAVAASSSFHNSVMLWLLLVGVPSSGKTDLVRLIKAADTTYYLDNLTQNAFISGERANKDNKVYDLLPLLDKKCLVIKDWTSIFSLDEKATKKLLGDLVNIYDKEFTKFSSRRGNISYSSAFSQLGCITPATLNKHTQYMNMVGPRFLCYTMPSSSFEEDNQSYEQIFSNQDRSLIEKEARLYVSSYLTQLVQNTPDIKPFSKEIEGYLRTAAELMANCRGIAQLQATTFRKEDGEEIKYYEVSEVQIEQPWRAVQQLITLAKYLAFVVRTDEVGVNELAIIKEVVISSMPADRSQALRIVKDQGGSITAKGLTEFSDRSIKTSRRLLDELAALKVLEKIKGSGTTAADYKIYSRFQDFLLLDPTEFMSHKEDRGTETPHSIDQANLTEANSTFPTTPAVSPPIIEEVEQIFANPASQLEKELENNPKEKVRSLLGQNFKLISDKDLNLYLKTAEKWLTVNINQSQTDEYYFIHSIWEKISKEAQRREKEVDKKNESIESNQRSINEI